MHRFACLNSVDLKPWLPSDEETVEVDCQITRLDQKPPVAKPLCIRKTEERPFEDHVAVDGGEGNGGDVEDLEVHSIYSEGSAGAQGLPR